MSTIEPTGILHPKMTNRFMVAYRASLRSGQTSVTEEDLAAGLQVLSMQTMNIKLPMIALQDPSAGFRTNEAGMFRVSTIGQVEFELQDDVQSRVLKTLLALRAADDVSIIVMKLDGNEGVLDAYKLRNVVLRTVEHSELRYDGGSQTVRGNIMHHQPDERGNVPRSEALLSLNTNTFGAGATAFRVKGDVGSMLMSTSTGLTIQQFLEIV